MLVAVLRLLGSLFQVLGPTYDRLSIPNLDVQFFVTTARSYSISINKAENFIQVVKRMIIVKI